MDSAVAEIEVSLCISERSLKISSYMPSSKEPTLLTLKRLQAVTYNTDIAKLLLISRAVVVECWPAEEYALQNGKHDTAVH